MARDFTKGLNLKSYEEIMGKSSGDSESAQSTIQIKISDLHDFKNHPFKVVDDEDMEELVQSIQEIGVTAPIEVRPDREGYEIVSGHRRTYASKKAGLLEIPAIVKEMPDYMAVLRMTAANKYRSKIYPSEKAHAYKMQYEALKEKVRIDREKGIKQDKRTDAMLADSVGEARSSVQRYLKLNDLTKEMLELVDSGDLSLIAAQQIANISIHDQDEIYVCWKESNKPKLTQEICENLYKIYQEQDNNLSDNDILMCLGVLKMCKPKPVKVTLNEKRLSQYFPDSYTQEEIESVIDALLGEWAKQMSSEWAKKNDREHGKSEGPLKMIL